MRQTRWFVALMSIAAFFRLADLNLAKFWYDESFTLLVSRLPFDRMMQALSGDTHPPLYYVITWMLVRIGLGSEFGLRFFSVLASLAAIWVVWQITERLSFPDQARWAAVIVMAFSPMQIHFAQEARMYALFQLEILLALLALLQRQYIWYILALIAALYTHNYGLVYGLVLAIIGIVLELFRPVDQGWVPFPILASLIALLAWTPWGIVLLSQMETLSSGGYWIQPVTTGAELYAIYMLFWGFAMPESWQPLSVMVTLGMVIFSALRGLQARPGGQQLLLLWWGFAPLVLVALASLLWQPILLFRGLIPSSPALYILAAWALTRLRWQRIYAGAMVLPILLAGLYGHYLYNPDNKGDITGMVEQIRAAWQPGDLIYHVNDGSLVGWLVYGYDLWPQVRWPGCENIPLGSLSERTRQGLGNVEIPMENLHFTRAWIIWAEGPTSPECEEREWIEIIKQSSLVKLDRSDEYTYSGVWLYVEAPPGAAQTP